MALGRTARKPITSGVDIVASGRQPGEIRYVRTTDIAGLKMLKCEPQLGITETNAAGAVIQFGDILMTRSGSLGTSYIHCDPERMAYAGYLVRYRPNTGIVHPGYVAWWTQSRHHLDQVSVGAVRSTIDNFSASKFSMMSIPVPPMAHQSLITDFLDRETAKIDALIKKQRALIVGLRERRNGTITSVTGSGLPGKHSDLRPGGRWTGRVPAPWDVVQLRRIVKITSGVGFPIEHQGVEGEIYPFYKVNSLSRADYHGIIRLREDSVNSALAQRLGARIVPAGSLVMAKIGAALLLGRIRLVESDCCIDNNMIALEVNNRAHPRFMFYALHRLEISLLVNPGAIPSLSEKTMRSYPISLPALKEQREIVEYLDRETGRIDTLIAKSERMIELSQERRAALITAAVTGQIDVAEMESSEEAA